MTAKTQLMVATVATLFLTGCLEKEKIAAVGDAENILFTTQGDLLVSGGESIYQIHKVSNEQGEASYEAISVYHGEPCSFTGIAQRDNWVFTVCSKPYIEWQGWTFKAGIHTWLMAADLDAEGAIEFTRLEQGIEGEGLSIPNGMAFTPDGKLLVADTNYVGQGSVGRITLDFSGPMPAVAHFEKDWLDAEYGVTTPNGVRVADNRIYVSNNNTLRRFYLDDNHEVPHFFTDANGNMISNLPDDNVLYTGGITLDDILPYCGGVAITQFVEGKLVFVGQSGKAYKTGPFTFKGPSSLAIGQGPDFNGHDLLVTEKGILLDNHSSYGNQLTRVFWDEDLNAPETCEAVYKL